ncbi:spindle assembly abnormal protein 6, putative [Ichthyophthirius multifiliis]|uniref:Spindle assembly abnormal protein 6, putative n=1 Tax=Ichthyophthirius multifiliis TaxID=5932 RepID=G0R3W8_ICHMU|nr:spindle assembly abnormal protein 6, putative [Ichthyophthirius multifiliis]EGR27844.1 spindle assembly abnormal protein 6, putative [Ichthyophthirius multifiliis]|eukprot:XP_004027189.1 spindle assembly abnormal protein 6, putative [Ichthyophthirius multifiliis]
MSEYYSNYKKIDLNKSNCASQNSNRKLDNSFQNQKAIKQNQFTQNQQSRLEQQNMNSFIQSQKDIFEDLVPIKIKQIGKQDIQTFLNLKIYTTQKGNNSNNQVHRIELTDEQNSLFLYLLDITETDFIQLKKEQNMKADKDFNSFPQTLVDLVNQCSNEEYENEKHQYQQKIHNNIKQNIQIKHRYQCQLDVKNMSDADFNIIQQNSFNTLNTLQLKLRQANDDALKSFISKKLQLSKVENEQLRIQNSRLEEQLSQTQMDFGIANEELHRIQEDNKKHIQQVQLEEQRNLNLAKEQYLNKEEQLRRMHESQKVELEQVRIFLFFVNTIQKLILIYSEILERIKFLQEKFQQKSQKFEQMSQRVLELEAFLQEYQNKCTLLEKEQKMNTKEIQETRTQNIQLSEMRFQQEKKITELTYQKEAYLKQIEDKEQMINSNKELVDNFNSQKVKQQKNIFLLSQQQKGNVKIIIKKLELCGEEINKGNNIIEKLQEDLTKFKTKIKQKNQMVIQQEQELNEVRQKQDDINNELAKKNREINNLEFKVKELELHNQDLKEKQLKVKKLQKIIKQ